MIKRPAFIEHLGEAGSDRTIREGALLVPQGIDVRDNLLLGIFAFRGHFFSWGLSRWWCLALLGLAQLEGQVKLGVSLAPTYQSTAFSFAQSKSCSPVRFQKMMQRGHYRLLSHQTCLNQGLLPGYIRFRLFLS